MPQPQAAVAGDPGSSGVAILILAPLVLASLVCPAAQARGAEVAFFSPIIPDITLLDMQRFTAGLT